MCLAIPAVVKKINRNIAEIESLGVLKKIDISLVPDVRKGDYVIVHAGFAIQVIDKEEALITEDYWKQYFTDEAGFEDNEEEYFEAGDNEDVQ
ncbi:MAG: HypC/HybG/HupF family hydrogenase formation chaperone [Actinobacteria bacterium]|nr:HypC/HybG/HupF family hydrogenase formation chaperone [Actinomycetota bacterium]